MKKYTINLYLTNCVSVAALEGVGVDFGNKIIHPPTPTLWCKISNAMISCTSPSNLTKFYVRCLDLACFDSELSTD